MDFRKLLTSTQQVSVFLEIMILWLRTDEHIRSEQGTVRFRHSSGAVRFQVHVTDARQSDAQITIKSQKRFALNVGSLTQCTYRLFNF